MGVPPLLTATDLSGKSETFAAATRCCDVRADSRCRTALVRCLEPVRSGPGQSSGQQTGLVGAVTLKRYAPRAVALRRSSAPDRRSSLLAAPRLGWWARCLPVSAPQVRRRCHSGRHGRRRVAGRSLSALISLRNGQRGTPPGRAAHCSKGAAAAPCASYPLLPCSRRRCAAARPVAGGLGRRRRPADRPVVVQRARNGVRWWRDLALRPAHAG